MEDTPVIVSEAHSPLSSLSISSEDSGPDETSLLRDAISTGKRSTASENIQATDVMVNSACWLKYQEPPKDLVQSGVDMVKSSMTDSSRWLQDDKMPSLVEDSTRFVSFLLFLKLLKF